MGEQAAPEDADPAEIVPARVVLLSTRACQHWVGRAPAPSDQGRDQCRRKLSPVRSVATIHTEKQKLIRDRERQREEDTFSATKLKNLG